MDWSGQTRLYARFSARLCLTLSVAASGAAQLPAQAPVQAPAKAPVRAPAKAPVQTPVQAPAVQQSAPRTSTQKQPAVAAPAALATVDLTKTAISLVPADAAFFSTSLKLQQCWDKEVSTGWVAEVRRVPYVQRLEQFLQEQWENPQPQTEQVKTVLSSPIVRDVLSLLGDMASTECFIYADHNWCEFLESAVDFQYQLASFNSSNADEMRDYVLGLEKEDIDAIPLPTTVMGFQLSGDENARNQLDALEGILQLGLANVEQLQPLAKGLKRKDLKNGQILSMTFAAKDIPWQDIPAEDEDAQEVIDHIADLLDGRQIVVSMGVIDNRLLIALSDSADTLLNLEQKAENLLSDDAFAPLLQHQAIDLRGLSFASGEWRNLAWQSNFGSYFERLATQLSNAIVNDSENSEDLEDWQAELIEDAQWFDEKVADMMPEFGSSMAYSFVSENGTEMFAYDWSSSVLLENAEPLSVARHGGTGPLILLASRQRWLMEAGEMAASLLEIVPKNVEQLIDAGVIDEDSAEQVQEITDGVIPILEDMLATVRDKIVPALDGNESLVSVTALAMASQLGEDAPPPPAPLPLPEIGLVLKVKDKDQFLGGCEDLIQSINALIEFAREHGADVPAGLRVPAPDESKLPDSGMRYAFPTGAPAPLDQFELQLAINNQIAVMGYSTRQVRDLYQARPLVARPAWYEEDKATAAVGFIDFAGIFGAFKPWVHYGLSIAGEDLEQPLFEGQAGAPVPSGADILQIWDTFRKFGKSAGTTVIDEDDVTVSHWIWVGE